MDREIEPAKKPSAGGFVLWLILSGSWMLFLFWVSEHHPFATGIVLLFIVAFVIPVYFAMLILGKVLEAILNLFHR